MLIAIRLYQNSIMYLITRPAIFHTDVRILQAMLSKHANNCEENNSAAADDSKFPTNLLNKPFCTIT